MGIAGVTSKDVIKNSFDEIGGAAFITGQDIGTVEGAFDKIVKTGNLGAKQLSALGLNTDEVFNATGLTVDQVSAKLSTMNDTQRAAYISDIMQKAGMSAGNEKYKESWDHVLDGLGRAEQYITRLIGGLVLPLAIPAVNLFTGVLNYLASSFDHLNGPAGTVIKLIGGALVIFTAITGVLIAASAAYELLGIKTALANVQTIYSTIATNAARVAQTLYALATEGSAAAQVVWNGTTVKAIQAAAAHAGAITRSTVAQNSGILATVRSSAANAYNTITNALNTESREVGIGTLVAQKVALLAGAVASGVASTASGILTAAQWALNVAMDANPIGIVVLAIAALVAALVWAYYNIKPVHDAITFLWKLLTDFWDTITHFDDIKLWSWLSEGIGEAYNDVMKFFTDLANYLINLPANMKKWGHDIILGLINGIINAIPGLRQALSAIGINFPQSPPKGGASCSCNKRRC